jgi:aldehyde:ferredoxin oxidoreductase
MNGRAVIVNLTTGSIIEKAIEQQDILEFVGGRGLGVKLLSDLTTPTLDPLGPENQLIITTGRLSAGGILSCQNHLLPGRSLTPAAVDISGVNSNTLALTR